MKDAPTVDLVIIWRKGSAEEQWRHGPVLYRDSAGDVHEHPRSQGSFINRTPKSDFEYIWRRFVDGMAGNGYTYDYTARRGVTLDKLDQVVDRIIGTK